VAALRCPYWSLDGWFTEGFGAVKLKEAKMANYFCNME
jgi:hypothetical protein